MTAITPARVLAAASLAFAAENAGVGLLNDPERFDREFGRGAFAQTESDVLDLARGFVERFADTSLKRGRHASEIAAQMRDDREMGEAVALQVVARPVVHDVSPTQYHQVTRSPKA